MGGVGVATGGVVATVSDGRGGGSGVAAGGEWRAEWRRAVWQQRVEGGEGDWGFPLGLTHRQEDKAMGGTWMPRAGGEVGPLCR